MSSYFDKFGSDIAALAELPVTEFLQKTAEIEEQVIADVQANLANDEFPADLKKLIEKAIDENRITANPMNTISTGSVNLGRTIAATARYSPLLNDLHAIYHKLATRNLETKWGRWTDNPRLNNAQISEE